MELNDLKFENDQLHKYNLNLRANISAQKKLIVHLLDIIEKKGL